MATASALATSGGDHVPAKLWGLWQRVSLETPDAPPDTSTRVFWLQTPTLFVDIRIPATRVLSPDCAYLEDYGAAELAVLAQQDGFAGHASFEDDVCCWQREIAFQPPGGFPDEGRLLFRDDEMVEEGVHLPYREVWRRVADGDGSWLARRAVVSDPRRPDDPPTVRYLVAIGDWFLFARARSGPALEQAPTLLHLGASRSNCRRGLIALLDFEISLGRRSGARLPWEIMLSTLPFREGRALTPVERMEDAPS